MPKFKFVATILRNWPGPGVQKSRKLVGIVYTNLCIFVPPKNNCPFFVFITIITAPPKKVYKPRKWLLTI